MTNAVAVHDVAHLHSGAEFAPLRLGAKNTDLRLRQIFQHNLGHVVQGSFGVFFENEDRVFRAQLFDLFLKRGRDFSRDFVGNDCDSLVRLQAQTIADGVARPGLEFLVDYQGVGAVGHNGERAVSITRKTGEGNPGSRPISRTRIF